MSLRSSLLTILAAGAVALVSAPAHATVTSSTGYLSLSEASSDSASHSEAGYDFGIGYSVALSADAYDWYAMTSQAAYYKDAYTFDASGSIELPATIFSKSFDLFKLSASGFAGGFVTGTMNTHAGYEVDVLGSTVSSGYYSLPVSTTLVSYCATFAEFDADFEFVGIPIYVDGSANGCVNVDASVAFDVSQKKLTFTPTPGATIDASLSTGFGDKHIGSVGIVGSLNVITLSLPLPLSAQVKSGEIDVTESGSVTMSGLSGDVKVKATALGVTLFKDTIFSWNGLSYGDVSLFSETQKITY